MKEILIAAATTGASLDLPNEIARTFSQSAVLASSDNFTEVGVEGIVIAAPGALPAVKAVDALERGRRIFGQKPPGRTGLEMHPIADAAQWRKLSVYEPCYAWSLQNPVIDPVIKHPEENTLAV